MKLEKTGGQALPLIESPTRCERGEEAGERAPLLKRLLQTRDNWPVKSGVSSGRQ